MGPLLGFGFLLLVFLFIGALLGFISYFKVKSLSGEVNALRKRVNFLQSHVSPTAKGIEKKAEKIPPIKEKAYTVKQVPVKKEEPATEKLTKKEETILPSIIEKKEIDKLKTEEKKEIPVEKPPPAKKQSEFLEKFEKNFLENWTGIIGAIIIVLGIGFFGIFAASRLSEMHRFFLIIAISIIFLIVYFILRLNKKWLKLGLWVRSIAAALFLLACAGAGGIPGLRWIENPLIGLVVLCLGIGANILLAVVGKKQVIASVHLLLSLTALAIAPQSQVIFIIATIVTLSGIILTFREKWEYHLLLTTTLYCAYIIFFYFQAAPHDMSMKITSIAGITTVSILSLFVHYRKIYAHPLFDVKPFFTHIFTWIYFGIGIFLYLPRISWISLPLGAGACLCFILAHRARALKIRWLFTTDVLMSQVIAVIAVITLLEWNVPYTPVVCILLIESLVFTTIVLMEGEDILFHCGQWFFYLASLLLFILSLIHVSGTDTDVLFRNAFLLSICIIATVIYHAFSNRLLTKRITNENKNQLNRKLFKMHQVVCGVIAGIFFLPLYIILRHHLPWAGYIDADYLILVPLCVVIFLRGKIQSRGLGVGILVTLSIMHILVWVDPMLTGHFLWYEKLLYSLPLFILDIACILFTYVKKIDKHIKWPGIYLLSAHLFSVTYFLFHSFSPLIPGVVWLVLSVIMLEISRFIRRIYGDECEQKGSPDIHFLLSGYGFLGAFLVFGYILVHLHSEQYIWIFKARLLIEIFALLIFMYWAFSKKPEGKKISKSYGSLHLLFPEFICIFAIITVAVEVENIYHPVIWILFSIAALFVGVWFTRVLSRFRFHSLFIYWLSVIHVIFLTSPLVTPSLRFFDKTWIFSLIAIVVQFGYIVFFYKKGDIGSVHLPRPLLWLERFVKAVEKRKNLWIYYPLFVSIALFLIRSFDASILTLLLSLECFFIFVVSIILKENHFRYLSLAGLGVCMIRLAFYDLAASNILTKAIVCVGVGLLLIGMNALYNKFSGRYRKS